METIWNLFTSILLFVGVGGELKIAMNCNVTSAVVTDISHGMLFDLEEGYSIIMRPMTFKDHYYVFYNVYKSGWGVLFNNINFYAECAAKRNVNADILVILKAALNLEEKTCPISPQRHEINRQFTVTIRRYLGELPREVNVEFTLKQRVGGAFAKVTLKCTTETLKWN